MMERCVGVSHKAKGGLENARQPWFVEAQSGRRAGVSRPGLDNDRAKERKGKDKRA
jgi:hypothetical protein